MASAKDLREKAKKLMEQAEQLENKKIVQLGKIVKKLHDSHFKDFHLDSFKKEVAAILTDTVKKEKTKAAE